MLRAKVDREKKYNDVKFDQNRIYSDYKRGIVVVAYINRLKRLVIYKNSERWFKQCVSQKLCDLIQ